MCGIISDMSIVSILIREFIPDLVPLLNDKTNNYSDFISNNFITTNLINLFTNKYIDENLSLFIWDLLFINGNLILIRSFLGIYNFLAPSLIDSEHSVEEFLSFVDNNLKKLKPDNEELLHYLFINDYNFIENEINVARFSLSSKFAKNINESYKEENNKKNLRKTSDKKKCNINWPICTCDNFKQKNVIFFSIFRKKKNGKYIEDYFYKKFNEDSKKEENDNNNIKDDEEINADDLLIERRKHFCLVENNEDKNINNEDKKDNLKDIKEEEKDDEFNKKINYQKIINSQDFIEEKMNIMNSFNIFKLNKSPQ